MDDFSPDSKARGHAGSGHLTGDFKHRAVARITERGYPVAEASKQLGVIGDMGRKPKATIFVHSDQGSQFTSMDWAAALKAHDLEHSMSWRGIAMTTPWQRASSIC